MTKRIFFAAALVLLSVSGPSFGQASGDSALSPELVQQRGHELHRDLVAEYRRLRAAGLIVYRRRSPDVTTLVARYIRPGTPFRAAMAILDAAGRLHRRRPPETGQLEPTPRGYIYVTIPLPTSILEFGAGYFCGITLIPKTPGQFTVVGDVKAAIGVDYL